MKPTEKPILVGGIIRSGTTWVGKTLARCEKTIYFHEPFNPDSPWNAALPLPLSHFHLNAENGGVYIRRFEMLLKLKPEIKGGWLAGVRKKREEQIARVREQYPDQTLRCIVKDPTALYSIEWLVENFDITPVMVARHPIAIARSLYRLGWSQKFVPGFLRKQPALMRHFYGEVSAADHELLHSDWRPYDAVQRALMAVRLLYLALGWYYRRYPQWHWLDYAALSARPGEQFGQLFEALELEMLPERRERLFGSGAGDYDPALHHQTELRAIPAPDIYANDDGIDWRAGFERYFSDIAEQFAPLCDWD